VEDASEGEFLVRDKLQPDGSITGNGSTRFVSSAFRLKSKYRTVDEYGEVLSDMAPLSHGDHFAFPIPVLPGRRVSVGDSWQAPIDVSLDWATSDPVTVEGEGRLEAFEWQNGYPCVKIHETFSGSTKFPTSKDSKFSGAPVDDLKVDQIVYFAYNSGRLIRVDAKTDITAELTSTQRAALDPFAGANAPSAYGGGPGYGQGLDPDAPVAGPPGGPPPGFGGPPGYGGGPPGLGGGLQGGGEQRSPVHLKITETTELQP
jgi:hypothetical protein